MFSDNPNHTRSLFNNFLSHGYEEKVRLYDDNFGIIPFIFPVPDCEVTWLTDEKLLNHLIHLFDEDVRGKNYHAKNCTDNQEQWLFDVRPQTLKQRVFLNRFIVSKFLQAAPDFIVETTHEIENSPNRSAYLTGRIDELSDTIDRIRKAINIHDNSLKTKFLKIFYHGYVCFETGSESLLKIKRKFAELYVYSHGVRIARLLAFLKQQIKDIYVHTTSAPLSLQQKIVLLHQLGIIDFLEKKFKKCRRSEYKMDLAQIISLMLIEERKSFPKILKYLNDLDSRKPDELSQKNVDSVRKELAKMNL